MLIGRQLVVLSGERPAGEGQGTCPLVNNGAKAGTRSIAVRHKVLIKAWHLQHRSEREGALECRKGLGSLRRLGECLLTPEASEWRSDGVDVPDELLVVAC
jgi:hypothetical protein